MKKVDLDWLEPQLDAWRAGAAAGRDPHAVLIAGAPGVGKRCLAVWLAQQRLGIPSGLPVYPAEPPKHPDLHWLQPPEDKKFILIEQVRELVAELNLTSYGGHGKVAVLEPASAMTTNAANSLLKTLEEPPGDALLILVADRPGRLPPTVRSRCQQISIPLPPEPAGIEWLNRVQPGAHWAALLRETGGAPLAALAAEARRDQMAAMGRDFSDIAERRVSPIDVAGRWAREDPEFVLEWLCRRIQRCIHQACNSSGGLAGSVVADSVLNRIDRRNLFCYLDIINGLRARPAGSFNVQLTLESLLIDWARGLRHCRRPHDPAASMPSGAG